MPRSISQQLRECLENALHRKDIAMAISTGTPSPFRKITAMILDSEGKVLGYAKIGENRLAIERIKNEAAVLKSSRFKVQSLKNEIAVPECLYDGELGDAHIIIQSPAPFEGRCGSGEFDEGYARVLAAIIKNTEIVKRFKESKFYKNLKEGADIYSLSYKDALEEGIEYIEQAIGDEEVTFALCHGDFTPWNMIWNGRRVFIYDWESASFEVPAGIDLVHFLFQTGFLLKKLRGEKLFRYIIENVSLSSLPVHFPENLILLYSFHMAVTEDEPQQLSVAAVERRNLVGLIVHG